MNKWTNTFRKGGVGALSRGVSLVGKYSDGNSNYRTKVDYSVDCTNNNLCTMPAPTQATNSNNNIGMNAHHHQLKQQTQTTRYALQMLPTTN